MIEELKEERDKALEIGNKSKQKIKRLEEALRLKEEETEKMSQFFLIKFYKSLK